MAALIFTRQLHFVDFRNQSSSKRKVKQGVPQGGVLSTDLFHLYMCSMPQPFDNINVVTYTDDITLLLSGPVAWELHIPMNACMEKLQTWLIDRHQNPSVDVNSMATLFSVWSAEVIFETRVDIGGYRLKSS